MATSRKPGIFGMNWVELFGYSHPQLLFDRGSNKIGVNARRLLRITKDQNGQCYHCGEFMLLRWRVDYNKLPTNRKWLIATIEHLKPQCRNGSNERSNVVAACEFCNMKRGHRPLAEFQAEMRQVGRTQMWKAFYHSKNYGNFQRFIRKALMRSYSLCWMNLFQYPEMQLLLAQGVIPWPNQFANQVKRTLKDTDFYEMHQFIRRINRGALRDYDPVTRQYKELEAVDPN